MFEPLLVAQNPAGADGDLGSAYPETQIKAIKTKAGDHLDLAAFLESDHPLGVVAVDRLVEDDPLDRARRIRAQDQRRGMPLRHARSLPPGQICHVISNDGRPLRLRLVDVRRVDREMVTGLGQQLPTTG